MITGRRPAVKAVDRIGDRRERCADARTNPWIVATWSTLSPELIICGAGPGMSGTNCRETGWS